MELAKVSVILGWSILGILGSFTVAWFGIRINNYANSRTAFASLRGRPYDVMQIPLKSGMSIGVVLICVELFMMMLILLTVDPAKREASFADDVPNPQFGPACSSENFKIGGLRCVDGAYEVKLIVWYDSKADATVFDAEIGGARTMICRRAGKFKTADKK